MKRNIVYLLAVVMMVCLSVGCTQELQLPENTIPTVVTNPTSAVSSTVAKITGEVVGNSASSAYFLVSTTDQFATAYTKKVKAEKAGAVYSAAVEALTPLTTYYYKFCVESFLPFDSQMLHRESVVAEGKVETYTTTEVVNEDVISLQVVDLGLSVKWAAWNLGATKPEEYGDYYAWGETDTKAVYTLETYQYYDNGEYLNIGTDISATSYDAAHVLWGEGWRMPTLKEMQELRSLCQWSWSYIGDVRGFRITGPSGKSIFLPAAGLRQGNTVKGDGANGGYWAASLNVANGNGICGLSFDFAGAYWYNDFNGREYGFTIRPVIE